MDRPFDEKRDSPDDPTWIHPRTKQKMVRHCMDWWFARVSTTIVVEVGQNL